jgi:anthraniloyl-CoA monooxygenase
MKIVVVGGGPSGLYAALLLKRARPQHEVVVVERNRAEDTFGWGVVFSDQTLENFRRADEPTFRAITEHFAHWDDIDVCVHGRCISSGGHGFSGIARRRLLAILQSRAREVGVDLRFSTDVHALADLTPLGLADADVIVAADGVNSGIRTELAARFEPDLDERDARFIWLGTSLPLDAFTFCFVETAQGVYQAHAYRFDEHTATFIVECDEASWRAAGFDEMDTAQAIEACEQLFARWLGEHHLRSNSIHRAGSPWTRFTRVRNARWHAGKVVLIGDAAHTAHFSIGSGTKLAMEDAIALAGELATVTAAAELSAAFDRYQEARLTESLRLQNAARNSMEWFEHVRRYIRLPVEQFAYSLLTRSQRVSHENLRLRDSGYVAGLERWFASEAEHAASATPTATPVPPMFTPFRLRGMMLRNRVVLAPMDMYSAREGTPNDFHLVHLGARALGGAALIMTEMACVEPDGRITLGCTGMYTPEHEAHWRRVVEFVHAWSAARICLQLGHAGRKGAVHLPWRGQDLPLGADAWPTIAPSAVGYADRLPVPREMTRDDMVAVREAFVRATDMALAADFDMLEVHAAHGYLLSSFLTPVSNHRGDAYGGSLDNRLRFPLEVFDAMRARWPADRPMSVRISATDWTNDGLTGEDAVAIARAFVDAGADIMHVSTGQTTSEAVPVYGRLFQTPFADMVRNEGAMPTIAVGNVTDADQVNGIIAAGRADLVAIGRPHLADPNWTLHAAARLGVALEWPRQYHLGGVQLRRELARAASPPTPTESA